MHFQCRRGRVEATHAAWPKLTAVFHTASQLIVGAVAACGPIQDSLEFPTAVRQAAVNLRPRRPLGDKGYDADHNHALCRQELGIRSAVIPLNSRNASGPLKGCYRRMMYDRFPSWRYRHRAQAESGLSRRQRRLGSALTARAEPNQFNELLIRTLTHNITVLAKAA